MVLLFSFLYSKKKGFSIVSSFLISSFLCSQTIVGEDLIYLKENASIYISAEKNEIKEDIKFEPSDKAKIYISSDAVAINFDSENIEIVKIKKNREYYFTEPKSSVNSKTFSKKKASIKCKVIQKEEPRFAFKPLSSQNTLLEKASGNFSLGIQVQNSHQKQHFAVFTTHDFLQYLHLSSNFYIIYENILKVSKLISPFFSVRPPPSFFNY